MTTTNRLRWLWHLLRHGDWRLSQPAYCAGPGGRLWLRVTCRHCGMPLSEWEPSHE